MGEAKPIRPCAYLEGDNVAPLTAAKARKLVGHRIQYLRRGDIDRSGRGYYFPRYGVVIGQRGRSIEVDSNHNYYDFGSFVEIVDLGPTPQEVPDGGR